MSVSSQQEAYRNIQFYLAAVKDIARADGNPTREIGAESLLESLEMLKPTERNEPYPGSYAEVVMLLHERDQIIAALRARPTLDHQATQRAIASALYEAADAWHAENAGTSPKAYKWLWARADAVLAVLNDDL